MGRIAGISSAKRNAGKAFISAYDKLKTCSGSLAEGKNDSGAADLDCSPWDDDFLGHLEQTERDIGITTGPKLFRSPGGVAWPGQLRLARNRGYECVLGCAYPHDPMHPAWIRIGFGKKSYNTAI
jgi:hypothetical protein